MICFASTCSIVPQLAPVMNGDGISTAICIWLQRCVMTVWFSYDCNCGAPRTRSIIPWFSHLIRAFDLWYIFRLPALASARVATFDAGNHVVLTSGNGCNDVSLLRSSSMNIPGSPSISVRFASRRKTIYQGCFAPVSWRYRGNPP